MMNMSDAQLIADAIESSTELLVVTGAGISLASGIPTFRGTDPDAVWAKDVTELGTFGYFRADPVGSWQWYMKRFDGVVGAKPNAAHLALVDLERWQEIRGGFLLVTQNIDVLHRRAGSRELVEVHGRADRVRCATYGCDLGAPRGSLPRDEVDMQPFIDAPRLDTVPRCPACQGLLRQHVLWFDEVYDGHADYQWERVQRAAMAADLVLFVGTSLAVGVTELFLQAAAHRGKPVILVDPAATDSGTGRTEVIAAKAEEILPEVSRILTT